jgi:hypothetical protein
MIFDGFKFFSGVRASLVHYNQYNFICYENLEYTKKDFYLNDVNGIVIDPFIGFSFSLEEVMD